MNMMQCPFIGGPLDGVGIADTDRHEVRVAERPDGRLAVSAICDPVCASKFVEPKITVYRRERFAVDNDQIYCYVAEGVSLSDAIRLLFRWYRPPTRQDDI
jgi:hypothetical protein